MKCFSEKGVLGVKADDAPICSEISVCASESGEDGAGDPVVEECAGFVCTVEKTDEDGNGGADDSDKSLPSSTESDIWWVLCVQSEALIGSEY